MAPAVRPKRSDYSREFVSLGFDFNYKDIERTLDDIGRKAMPHAAAKVINNAAFFVKRSLEEHTEKVFDKPNAFTRAAWLVDKAKSTDGEKMVAAIKARPRQAAYLQFQIFGGVRHKGDAGSGPYDLFAYSAKLTQYGGVDRKYLKKLSGQAKTERQARKALAAKRHAAAKNADMTPKERRHLQWNVASKNKPGVFFGSIYGLKGYWQRSERYSRAAKRKLGTPSWTKAGSHPRLLFAVKSEIRNKPRFMYEQTVRQAFLQEASAAKFHEHLSARMKLYGPKG